MKSVTGHILARKIPLHSEHRPLFYMPIKTTVLDTIIYLDPLNFHKTETIYRNHEKVPFYTVVDNDDIITYSLSKESTISKKWLEFSQSGISQWRIQSHLSKKV